MSKHSEDQFMKFTRRQTLSLGVAGATLAFATSVCAKPKKAARIPVGLQLWSVREDCAKDMDVALKAVADMGFEGVEFAGFHKYAKDAQGLRKKLDELKLKVAGSHVGAAAFGPDKIKETVAFHKTIGCPNLILGSDNRFSDPAKSEAYVTWMNATAAALKPDGLFCGHHNHTEEFKKVGDKPTDKTYWDLFVERTSKDVVIEHDIGWSQMAGMDPIALIRRFPGRTKLVHFKAKLPKGSEGKQPFIGEDVIDWSGVIKACREVGGTEWFLVEQEDYPDGLSPMDCTKRSLRGLQKILAADVSGKVGKKLPA